MNQFGKTSIEKYICMKSICITNLNYKLNFTIFFIEVDLFNFYRFVLVFGYHKEQITILNNKL